MAPFQSYSVECIAFKSLQWQRPSITLLPSLHQYNPDYKYTRTAFVDPIQRGEK